MDIVDKALSIDYVRVSIPFFILLVLIEIGLDRKAKKDFFNFNDTLANISCGAVQIITALLSASILIQVYSYLYDHHRLTALTSASVYVKGLCALALFLGVDFFYYWSHRFSHRVNVAWSGHGVHHQSEEYNLSVALRQSAFQVFFTWFFYLPLAVLGFSKAWYVSVSSFVTMYQFWIHTRFIKTLGPLEWVLNTPSHHRVHHAINGSYIDKNYAGTLIIWDRMFGSFVKEEHPCVYGTVKPLSSFNPVWAQFALFSNNLASLKNHQGFNKVKALLAPPGWPDSLEVPEVPRQTKYVVPLSRGTRVYATVLFSILVACGLLFIDRYPQLSFQHASISLVLVLLGFLSLGFILDQKKWAWRFETGRWVVTALGIATLVA